MHRRGSRTSESWRGPTREYDREALLEAFEAYIAATEIPIIAEFAAEKGLYKGLLYEWPEFFNLIT